MPHGRLPLAAQAIRPYNTASVTGIPVPAVLYGRALRSRRQQGALIICFLPVRLFTCLVAGAGTGAGGTDHGG
ncbi:MAG TPA: hypothetical protein VGD83_14080 [Streptosporangiaceae bacterium]